MIIVAGIARSGLTMTMQMLHAGGYPCLGDRPAFEPYGIGKVPWLSCQGKAVKLIDTHLQFPPLLAEGTYKVIRLHRNMTEQAKSFRKMVNAFTDKRRPDMSRLIKSYKHDYKRIDAWAKRHETLRVQFESVLSDPFAAAEKIRDFVGVDLDVDKMADAVLRRSPKCHSEILELGMV